MSHRPGYHDSTHHADNKKVIKLAQYCNEDHPKIKPADHANNHKTARISERCELFF
jgi:hypothetical protein